MNKKQRERIQTRLLEERRARLEALAEFDERYRERLDLGDDDLSHYPLHMADEGTDAIDQETSFLLASQDGRQLMEIDQALQTLYGEPESFGVCGRCGGAIAFERLEMVPWARLCIECKTVLEEAGADGPAV